MRKLKGVVAALALAVAFSVSVHAEAVAPSFSGGKYFSNPSFIGVKVGIIDRTIAPTVIDSNQSGLLYAICREGAATDDYALAWDYFTSLSPLSSYVGMEGSGGEVNSNLDQIISPYVFGNFIDATASDYIQRSASSSCWVPPWPAHYDDGLIGLQNSAGGYSLFFFRSDDGQNPN